MASLAPFTVTSLATTGNLNITGTASTGVLTATGLNDTGNLATTGTSGLTGPATASAGINVPGNTSVTFGSDQTKAALAGSIGYQLTTPGTLDIYGAGTAAGSRNIKLWDNITVPGTSTFTGKLTATGGAAVTGGLTVDGKAVTGGTGGTVSLAKKLAWTNVPRAAGAGVGTLQCSVDALGIGRLRGRHNNGSLGYTVQATIPAAARPIQGSYYIAIVSNSGNSFLIGTDGNITQTHGPSGPNTGQANQNFDFDGISYDTSAT